MFSTYRRLHCGQSLVDKATQKYGIPWIPKPIDQFSLEASLPFLYLMIQSNDVSSPRRWMLTTGRRSTLVRDRLYLIVYPPSSNPMTYRTGSPGKVDGLPADPSDSTTSTACDTYLERSACLKYTPLVGPQTHFSWHPSPTGRMSFSLLMPVRVSISQGPAPVQFCSTPTPAASSNDREEVFVHEAYCAQGARVCCKPTPAQAMRADPSASLPPGERKELRECV